MADRESLVDNANIVGRNELVVLWVETEEKWDLRIYDAGVFCNLKGGGVIYILPPCFGTKFRSVPNIGNDGRIILVRDSVK